MTGLSVDTLKQGSQTGSTEGLVYACFWSFPSISDQLRS